MKTALLCLGLFFGAVLPLATPDAAETPASDPGDPAENRAVRVASLQFLSLVDEGSYTRTWNYAGHYLRAVSTREEWAQGLASARQGSGALQGRDLLAALFTPKLEDGKTGRYYVVGYVTRFENGYWREEVTLARQGDAWVVEGYWMFPSDSAGNTKDS